MGLDIFTPYQLYRIMFDPRQTVSTSQWLDMFFPNSFLSTQEEIAFSKISASRRIAPFMLPNLPGQPIYRREGESVSSFKPAYTKPKDSIRPSEMLALQPGELARRTALMSPEARYNAEVVRITQFQRNAIQRLWDYMAAKALLDGSLTINYAPDQTTGAAQSVTLDFGRDAGQTITLGAGSRWGDSGVNIFDVIQSWVDMMALAAFGGSASDLILGSAAAVPFMASKDIKDKMSTIVRGSPDVTINMGIIRTDPLNPFTFMGYLDTGLKVWRYAGPGATFQNADGSYTNIMDPRDALLVSPAVDGVKAFGAIIDTAANLQVADIFTKMWDNEDPSARFIMSQSAPLMIPTNPNCTLRARTVA
jgi:hypothetical protein